MTPDDRQSTDAHDSLRKGLGYAPADIVEDACGRIPVHRARGSIAPHRLAARTPAFDAGALLRPLAGGELGHAGLKADDEVEKALSFPGTVARRFG